MTAKPDKISDPDVDPEGPVDPNHTVEPDAIPLEGPFNVPK